MNLNIENQKEIKSIPYEFYKKYENFVNWHYEKKSLLKQGNDHSFNYLKENFAKWRDEYMVEIEKMGNATYHYAPETRHEIKNFIKGTQLYKEYLKAPCYRQIIEKPRGYAGDADMMEIIYRNEFEGDSLFSKMIHKIGTEFEASASVRNRRYLLTKEIMKTKGSILSLAAGPSAEIFDCIKESTKNDKSFLALDHDIETLRKVKRKDTGKKINYGIVNAFQLIKGKKTVLFPKRRYLDICDPQNDIGGIRKFTLPLKYKIKKLNNNSYSLIYTAGLYDYIETFENENKGTIALTKVLFSMLKPGGSLIIGNFSHKNPIGIRWVMEFICDWNLIYRTEEDILKFSKGICEKEINKIQIIKEENEINYFLKITKK